MLIYDPLSDLAVPLPMTEPSVPVLPPAAHPLPRPEDGMSRLRALLMRFRLPELSDEEEVPARAELAVAAETGSLAALQVACLLGCLARCSSAGPLVADGAWSGSTVLAACGVVCVSAGAGGGDLPDIPTLARAGELGAPRLLAGREIDALLDWARLEAPLLRAEACGEHLLRLWHSGPEDDPLAARCPVELVRSDLLSLVRRLQQHVERHAGIWIDEQCVPDSGRAIGHDLASVWQPHLPELPSWGRGVAASESVDATWRAWCAAAPSALPATARAAFRTRAHLAWFFTYLASQHGAGAWAALLGSARGGRFATIAAAARAAGLTLAGPSVLVPHLEWEPVGGGVVRCGLGAVGLPPALVQALVSSLEEGPFRSAFEMIERIPDIGAWLLPLAAAGALDGVHARPLLLGSWGVVSAWLGQIQSCRGAGLPAPAPPELTDGAASPSRQRLWAAVYAPCTPAALGVAPDEREEEEAGFLPSAVQVGSPGEVLRVCGFVRERRTLRENGDELVLLALTDAGATVHLVLAWDGAPVPSEPGCWVCCSAVRSVDPRVLLDPSVALVPASRAVRVTVPRTGDRDADLSCLVRVHEVLDAHPGCHPVAIAVQSGERLRVLDLGMPTYTAWTPALVAALEAVVGRHGVVLEDGGT